MPNRSKNAVAASGRFGTVKWSKLSRKRELTEAKTTAASTRSGLATSALRVTPPPIERPSIATWSGSTYGSVAQDATALIVSSV